MSATQFKAQCLALPVHPPAGREIVVHLDRSAGAVLGRSAAEPQADFKASVTFHVDDDELIEPFDVVR